MFSPGFMPVKRLKFWIKRVFSGVPDLPVLPDMFESYFSPGFMPVLIHPLPARRRVFSNKLIFHPVLCRCRTRCRRAGNGNNPDFNNCCICHRAPILIMVPYKIQFELFGSNYQYLCQNMCHVKTNQNLKFVSLFLGTNQSSSFNTKYALVKPFCVLLSHRTIMNF